MHGDYRSEVNYEKPPQWHPLEFVSHAHHKEDSQGTSAAGTVIPVSFEKWLANNSTIGK